MTNFDANPQPQFNQSDERIAQLLRNAAQQPAAPSPSILSDGEVQQLLREAGAAPVQLTPGQLTDAEVIALLEAEQQEEGASQ